MEDMRKLYKLGFFKNQGFSVTLRAPAALNKVNKVYYYTI